MKAAIWTRFGAPEVLELGDLAKPTPQDDEVLVSIRAANVFPGDCELRRFEVHPLFWLPVRLAVGVRKPRIKVLGQEFSGVVEAVGKRVTAFKVGDEVISPTGLGGAYAEFICLKPRRMIVKPPQLSFEEATALAVGGLNALHFLRCGELKAGQTVLLNGAGGSIGTLAIQIAKAMDAQVTAVDSGPKLEALRNLGADEVIDYTAEDFTSRGECYDVVVDIVGKGNYAGMLRAVKTNGYLVLGNAPTSQMIRRTWSSVAGDRNVRIALAGYRREDLLYLSSLVAAGNIKPLIDRCYSLNDVVAAHHYVESGKRIGNVVLTIGNNDKERMV